MAEEIEVPGIELGDQSETKVSEELKSGEEQELDIETDKSGFDLDDIGTDVSEESEELVITIGDQPNENDEFTGKPAPGWAKRLREKNKELSRQIRELKSKTETKPELELGPEPTLEEYDHDEKAFKEAWKKRILDEQKIESQKNAEKEREQSITDAFVKKLQNYEDLKKKEPLPGIEDAEDYLNNLFGPRGIGMFLDSSKQPHKMAYILYNNPKKAQELAAMIDTPLLFAAEIGRTEAQLKETKRTVPKPERRVVGDGNSTLKGDKILERLRAEADKTGDRTKVAEYLRKQREKQ